MNAHSLARTNPFSRMLMVKRVRELGWTVEETALAAAVTPKTVRKWIRRFELGGAAALADRSSRPRSSPRKTPVERERVVLELRRAFRYTAPQIAAALRMPTSTVSAVLARAGENRLPPERPRPPVVRYEHAEPGDLLHMDVKKLARFERPGHRVTGDRRVNSRGSGYDFVHVCIDDHSRVAYVEVLPDEKGITTVGFLRRAVTWFAELGVPSKQLLTDNGTNYRSMVFRQACVRLGIKHRRTRPYTPRTNGKAERFIQTLLREWAYGRQYANSLERTALLPKWLRYYNRRRRHGSVGNVPASRLRRAA